MFYGYENLVELLKKVKASGMLDTSIEEVVKYQDMIGHSTAEQLKDLSNGAYQHEFYRVMAESNRIEDVITFYVNNSDKIAEIMDKHENTEAELLNRAEKAEKELASAKEEEKTWRNKYFDENAKKAQADQNAYRVTAELENVKQELENTKREIVELKAKLYDLMITNNRARS